LDHQALPEVYSGECFHHANTMNSNHPHYGVILLDTDQVTSYMWGLFGFFYNENPYKDWTVDVARRELIKGDPVKHKLENEETYSFADLNPGGQERWWYWLRQADTENFKTLYLLATWGMSHQVFCELRKH
jgi:hypothetical protein